MGHTHTVTDTDARFVIDVASRAINRVAGKKNGLMQFDHNSERLTFEMPRYAEDHDMTKCNLVEVHYLNIDQSTKKEHSGLYEVTDLAIDSEDENKITFSWLITRGATQHYGKLNFMVSFACIEDGVIEYAWHTDIFADTPVRKSIDASGAFETEYVEIIERWKASVMAHFTGELDKWKVETAAGIREEATDAISSLSAYVTPQMFGAIGDGVADDTEAVKDAIACASEHNKMVFFPKGVYLISAPIVIPSGLDICGSGATVFKNDTTTVELNGMDVNAAFVLSGSKIYMHDIRIRGSVDNGVDGIAFAENTFMLSVSRVTLDSCRKCFNDIGGLFMAEFDRVHCVSSLCAFVFDANCDKTSMTFKSCWAENCGQAYYMRRCQYTNLISCGADYCNSANKSPYSVGYGDPTTKHGVYTFELCRAVVMTGCGVENSWGNGAVLCSASFLTINGLTCTNVKSEYNVDPAVLAVGMIVHDSEASRIIINSVMTNNAFENTYVSKRYPDTRQYLIAYNFSNGAYGARGVKGIIASGLLSSSSAPLLGGVGDYENECLLMDEHGKIVTVEKHLNLSGRKLYPVRNLTNPSGSDRLIIPFNAQSDANMVHLIRVAGISNAPNTNIPNAFEFSLGISSLDTANHATLVRCSSDAMSVDTSGMNAVIKLPALYTNLNISIETMSMNENLIDLDGIKLGAN